MKKRNFIVKSHVYPLEVMVLYDYSFDEAEKALKKVIPSDIHDEIKELEPESSATTLMFSNGVSVMLFKPDIPLVNLNGIIVHECFHAVDNILDTVGMKLTHETSEAYAYLLQYLFESIVKKVNKC